MKRRFGKITMMMLTFMLLVGVSPAMNVFAEINYDIPLTSSEALAAESEASRRGDYYSARFFHDVYNWKGSGNESYRTAALNTLQTAIMYNSIVCENGSIIYIGSNMLIGTYTYTESTDVINMIDAIGTVEYTEACKACIDDARSAYDVLTDDQKSLVTNIAVLTAAELDYEDLKADADAAAAAEVIAKISAIGEVTCTEACKAAIDEAGRAYEALTEDQKALVTNHADLMTAESSYASLKAIADTNEAAAAEVSNKISAIGTAAYTEACKAVIDEARRAYEALTEDQKALVTNFADLTAAESDYAAFKTAAEKAAEDAAAAAEASNKISAIGTAAYTEACRAEIDEARRAYEALTEEQKALVTNYAVLTAAENDYAALKAEAEKAETQEDTKPSDSDVVKPEKLKGCLIVKAVPENSKVKLTWNKIEGAESYTIYTAVCGKNYKEKATVTGTQYTVKKLNNKKEYKFYVKANGGANSLKSVTCHVAMSKNKRTNPKSISVNTKKVTLKAGKSKTLKVTIKKAKAGKKLINHVASVRYYTSDANVAKVNKKGKITAVGKGMAEIYAVAQNGLSKTVAVTVK